MKISKKHFALIISYFLISQFSFAQNTEMLNVDLTKIPQTNTSENDIQNLPLRDVEEEVDFIGGEEAFVAFLEKNLKYPESAISANIQGVIKVEFVVDIDGSVSNVKIANKKNDGIDRSALEQEAMRVVWLTSNMWKPGKLNKKHVKSYHMIPLTFLLEVTK